MAKKQVPGERERTPQKLHKRRNSPEERNKTPKKNSKTLNKSTTKTKKSTPINTKNRNKVSKTANDDDASGEESKVLVVPSSSTESENDDVVKSVEDLAEKRSLSDGEEEEENETLMSIKNKGKKNAMKNNGKKRSREEEEEDKSEAKDSGGKPVYRFPIDRVSQIIKNENPDIKISEETAFIITRASEKFLHTFCREAYAFAFLDDKKDTTYDHLASVVAKRKRLHFLSDYIPERIKAEDALARTAEAEK